MSVCSFYSRRCEEWDPAAVNHVKEILPGTFIYLCHDICTDFEESNDIPLKLTALQGKPAA